MERELLENLELENVEVEFDNVVKKKKRRVIKRGFILFLTFVLILSTFFLVMFSSMFRLQNITIEGNTYLTNEEVIQYGKIYPGKSVVIAHLTEIEQNLEEHDIVKNARVEFDGRNDLKVVIEEEPVLFSTPKGVYLLNGLFIKTDVFSPVVDFENFDKAKNQDFLLEELAKLYTNNPNVYEFISQITFEPDSVTDDRIKIVMRDSNVVYLSVEQISTKMSKYFEVVDSIYTEYGVVYGVLSFDKGGEFKPY